MLDLKATSEIVQLTRSEVLFRGTTAMNNLLITYDFDAALQRATNQPEPGGGYTVDWTDLREHHASLLGTVKYALAREERARFDELSESIAVEIGDNVFSRLAVLGFERAHNEVSTDLWKVAISRLLGGNFEFWERVFALYREGLWPCGWDGEAYPDGRFVAFSAQRV